MLRLVSENPMQTPSTQLDLQSRMPTVDECLREAQALLPSVTGPNKARSNVDVVARILELRSATGLRARQFYKRVGANPSTWGYYERNRHSDGSAWPELEDRRSAPPAISVKSPEVNGPAIVVKNRAVKLGIDDSLVFERITIETRVIPKTDPEWSRYAIELMRSNPLFPREI